MITIANTEIEVVVSHIGGELQSIRDRETGLEYLWQGNADWRRSAINLFPFIGRFFEKSYTVDGQSFGANIHGFLPNAHMTLQSSSDTSCCFVLCDDNETRQNYPFAFQLTMLYVLERRSIKISFELHNRSKKTMYFAVGGHPGFNIPLEPDLTFEDYEISFPVKCEPKQIEFAPSALCTGQSTAVTLRDGCGLALQHSLFTQDAVVLGNTPGSVTLSSPKGSRGVTICYPQMPYLGLWHRPNTNAPYLCLEPWSSLPGRDGVVEELADKEDLIALPMGECYTNCWSISAW